MAQAEKNKINIQAYVMIIALLFIWIFFHFLTVRWDEVFEAQGFIAKSDAFFDSGFLQARNLSNLSRQFAVTAITAIGMVYVIIAGEIDLSIGSQLALLGGVLAMLDFGLGLPPVIVIPAVLIMGCILGLWNGFWVSYMGVPSFIVTLAGMMAFRGLSELILQNKTIAPTSDFYSIAFSKYYFPVMGIAIVVAILSLWMLYSTYARRQERQSYGLALKPAGNDYMLTIGLIAMIWFALYIYNNYKGVPPVIVLLAVLASIFTWVGRHTKFGRYIYALGGNLEATRLSGVNVKQVKMLVFMVNGLMAGIASVTLVGRLGSAAPSAGSWQELYTIAACFIGGTSMKGGIGTVYGAITGGLVMASLQTGMQLKDINVSWQSVIIGGVLLLAVFLDVIVREGKLKLR
ncbi:MAG: sugar ABC transporter permease [Alphaproteobacteria bacterium]